MSFQSKILGRTGTILVFYLRSRRVRNNEVKTQYFVMCSGWVAFRFSPECVQRTVQFLQFKSARSSIENVIEALGGMQVSLFDQYMQLPPNIEDSFTGLENSSEQFDVTLVGGTDSRGGWGNAPPVNVLARNLVSRDRPKTYRQR